MFDVSGNNFRFRTPQNHYLRKCLAKLDQFTTLLQDKQNSKQNNYKQSHSFDLLNLSNLIKSVQHL